MCTIYIYTSEVFHITYIVHICAADMYIYIYICVYTVDAEYCTIYQSIMQQTIHVYVLILCSIRCYVYYICQPIWCYMLDMIVIHGTFTRLFGSVWPLVLVTKIEMLVLKRTVSSFMAVQVPCARTKTGHYNGAVRRASPTFFCCYFCYVDYKNCASFSPDVTAN
jgi:hypothetical protein